MTTFSLRRAAAALMLLALVITAALSPMPARAQASAASGVSPNSASTDAPSQTSAPASGTSTMTGQSTIAPPATPGSKGLQVGPELGAFFPEGKLGSRFGHAWFSAGLGLGSIPAPTSAGQFGIDLNLFARIGSNSHAYIAPLGVQYRIALAQGGSAIPYIGMSGDLVLADIRSDRDHAHSGLMETGGASAFAGITIGRNAYAEARYLALGSVQGFGLSGADLTLGLRF